MAILLKDKMIDEKSAFRARNEIMNWLEWECGCWPRFIYLSVAQTLVGCAITLVDTMTFFSINKTIWRNLFEHTFSSRDTAPFSFSLSAGFGRLQSLLCHTTSQTALVDGELKSINSRKCFEREKSIFIK